MTDVYGRGRLQEQRFQGQGLMGGPSRVMTNEMFNPNFGDYTVEHQRVSVDSTSMIGTIETKTFQKELQDETDDWLKEFK